MKNSLFGVDAGAVVNKVAFSDVLLNKTGVNSEYNNLLLFLFLQNGR